jgi:hypothetical protein
MAKQTKEEIIESGVCHFRVGEDLGLRLMEIAQEHLTERNDPIQALKTITDSLMGCPTDLAIQILLGKVESRNHSKNGATVQASGDR